MRGPYVNEEGEVWIERGSARWPAIQREARNILDEMGYDLDYVMRYEGIVKDARVSDENEFPHLDDVGCIEAQGEDYDASTFVPCCRTIEAHNFRAVER